MWLEILVCVCVCLKGSVASLLYVLFAYEIRYSKSNLWRPLPPLLASQDLCIYIAHIARYADIWFFFDSILFPVYDLAWRLYALSCFTRVAEPFASFQVLKGNSGTWQGCRCGGRVYKHKCTMLDLYGIYKNKTMISCFIATIWRNLYTARNKLVGNSLSLVLGQL